MYKYIKILIIFSFISNYLIPSSSVADDDIPSDLQPAPNPYLFNTNVMGKIVIYGDKDIKNNSIISMSPLIQQTKSFYIIGKTRQNEAYEITLIPGKYRVDIDTKSGFLSPAVSRTQRFTIEGGKVIYARASGDAILIEQSPNSKFENTKVGALVDAEYISRRYGVKLKINNWSISGTYIHFDVYASGYVEIPTFAINDKTIEPDTTAWRTTNKVSFIREPNFSPGFNTLSISAFGADGIVITAKYQYYEKWPEQIERERVAKENEERIAEERRKEEARKAEERRKDEARKSEERRVEQVRKAEEQRKEAERIAREGDLTPDDLSCKKYGLLPQTQGYAECRMRLDLIRKEELARGAAIERARADELARAAANQRAIERARAEELARRNQQIEEQNAMVNNRASQCQFVRAQEYSRPGLNFATAAQNAEGAYNNCMAGVPQIQTTCTRDFFGNMNCTSR